MKVHTMVLSAGASHGSAVPMERCRLLKADLSRALKAFLYFAIKGGRPEEVRFAIDLHLDVRCEAVLASFT